MLYRARNRIERFFNRIKHFRRLATRYEKHAANFLAHLSTDTALSSSTIHGYRSAVKSWIEQEKRWEIDAGHAYATGIREDMSIDSTLHSLFGASKVAADILPAAAVTR